MDEEHWDGPNVAGQDSSEASPTDREGKSAGKKAQSQQSRGQPMDEPQFD